MLVDITTRTNGHQVDELKCPLLVAYPDSPISQPDPVEILEPSQLFQTWNLFQCGGVLDGYVKYFESGLYVRWAFFELFGKVLMNRYFHPISCLNDSELRNSVSPFCCISVMMLPSR